jgi:heptosyltransferase-2
MLKRIRGGGKEEAEGPRKILFIQTAFLGDVVFSTALLRGVTALYPRAEVTFLASPRGGGLLQGDRDVDKIIFYDKRGAERGLGALRRLVDRIRKARFDLVVSPHRSFRSAVIARFSGAPSRLGFRSGWGRWAFNLGVPWPRGEAKPYRRELRLLEGLGATVPSTGPSLTAGEKAREEVRRLLRGEGIAEGETLVGLVPGTVWPTKKWPVDHFVELAGRMSALPGVRVLILGGPDERAEGELFTGIEGVVNLAGRTTLAQLPALLEACDIVVAGDTGPLHAAMALGVPVVALFGPTDERQFEFETPGICLTEECACRPCRPHGSRRCPEGTWRCMPDISVGRVDAMVREVLSLPPPAAEKHGRES